MKKIIMLSFILAATNIFAACDVEEITVSVIAKIKSTYTSSSSKLESVEVGFIKDKKNKVKHAMAVVRSSITMEGKKYSDNYTYLFDINSRSRKCFVENDVTQEDLSDDNWRYSTTLNH